MKSRHCLQYGLTSGKVRQTLLRPLQAVFLPKRFKQCCRSEEFASRRRLHSGVLSSGESMEGLLLAYTMFDRILPDCMHGTTAPVRLFAKDQFGRKHRSEIEISIDRSATMRQMFLRSRGTGLYGDDGGVRPVVFSQPKPEPPNSIGERGSRMDKEKTQ